MQTIIGVAIRASKNERNRKETKRRNARNGDVALCFAGEKERIERGQEHGVVIHHTEHSVSSVADCMHVYTKGEREREREGVQA